MNTKSQQLYPLKLWLMAIRPKTLTASLGPVLLGAALASKKVELDLFLFFIISLC